MLAPTYSEAKDAIDDDERERLFDVLTVLGKETPKVMQTVDLNATFGSSQFELVAHIRVQTSLDHGRAP